MFSSKLSKPFFSLFLALSALLFAAEEYPLTYEVRVFTVPQCQYCKELAPELDSLEESNSQDFKIKRIDCQDAQNRTGICKTEGVNAFPKLELLAYSPTSKDPIRKCSLSGQRKADDIKKKIQSLKNLQIHAKDEHQSFSKAEIESHLSKARNAVFLTGPDKAKYEHSVGCLTGVPLYYIKSEEESAFFLSRCGKLFEVKTDSEKVNLMDFINLNRAFDLVTKDPNIYFIQKAVAWRMPLFFLTAESKSVSAFDKDQCVKKCDEVRDAMFCEKGDSECEDNVQQGWAECVMQCEINKDKVKEVFEFVGVEEVEKAAFKNRESENKILFSLLNEKDETGEKLMSIFGIDKASEGGVKGVLVTFAGGKVEKFAFRDEYESKKVLEFVERVFEKKEPAYYKSAPRPDYGLIDPESDEGLVKEVVGVNLKEFVEFGKTLVKREDAKEGVRVVLFGYLSEEVEKEKNKLSKAKEVVREIGKKARSLKLKNFEVGQFDMAKNEDESLVKYDGPKIVVYGKGAENGVVFEKLEEEGESGLVKMIKEKFGVELGDVESESEEEEL